MTSLQDKVYIITGGSRGLGLAIASTLVERGARVGLVGRNAQHLQNAIEQLGTDKAYAATMDVANRSDIAESFAAIKQHFGRLDGLVNNAGLARPARIDEMDEAEVLSQFNTNVMGTVFCCQAVLPLLQDTDNPRIINISSASAEHHDEMAHLSIYAASKSAVERFSRDLRRELQGDGVGVTILRPGSAPTEFAAGWDSEKLTHALKAWYERGTTMDTGMDSTHVADAVAYCLATPPGVSVDLLEIRPNIKIDKVTLD